MDCGPPTRPSVRIVTVEDDGSVFSISGLSLAEAGQKMQGEETIFPRMFLSREAERLIRSPFNCDAVYSQPVPPPPVGGLIGIEMGMRTCVGGGGGRERGALAVLSEMWETEYVDGGGWSGPVIGGGPGCVKTTYPPLEPAPSSFSCS